MDIWTKQKRSKVMSRIRYKDTMPEKRLRNILSAIPVKYRSNVNSLPGKPDIIIKKHKLAIFVHGCFWHMHRNCIDGKIPKSRRAYWREKLLNNCIRDKKKTRLLREKGWSVFSVWECQIIKKPSVIKNRILKHLAKADI